MTFQWTDREVRVALGMDPLSDPREVHFTGVSTDTRSVTHGNLFVALEGERFDGHEFLPEAFARGAAGAVVSRQSEEEEGNRLFQVPDTLLALGALARHWRKAFGGKVVGVTGSSGKTTTKDLLSGAIGGSIRAHATAGNFNNRIGLPLTLLSAPSDSDALVLEMGTNEPGEIRTLTEIAEPSIGVITTVSETHLEKLGSLDGVLEEKLDLLRGLPEDGVAVVGDEPPILQERARDTARRLLTAGWSDRVTPENRPGTPTVGEDGCFEFSWRGERVRLRMPGRHSVQNALIALAVSDVLGVPAQEAAENIGTVVAGGMRSEVRKLGQLTLLVDCYNANPQSLRAALDLLADIGTSGSRVAVLGSMLELGGDSESFHRKSLEEALESPLDLIVATGLFAEAALRVTRSAQGPQLVIAPDLDQARDALLQSLEGTEVLLLKASRGVAMEALIPSLESRFGPGKAA